MDTRSDEEGCVTAEEDSGERDAAVADADVEDGVEDGVEDEASVGAAAGETAGRAVALYEPQRAQVYDSDSCASRRRSSGLASTAPIAPLPSLGMKPMMEMSMVRILQLGCQLSGW
jgi:hypothetical protein